VTQDKKNSALRSPWFYFWISLVIIVLGVNITMIMFSADKNPGLVVEDFYERGQDYEENMLEKQQKSKLWKGEYQVEKNLILNQPANISFSLKGTQGSFATVDHLTLYVYRPADATMDFKVEMSKGENNLYSAQLTFSKKGVWDLLAAASIKGEEYNFAKRVFVKEK